MFWLPQEVRRKRLSLTRSPEIKLDALTANVKLDVAHAKVQVKNEGGAMKKAAVHVHLGYDDTHSVTIGPPGSTTEIDADVVDGT